MQYPHCRYLVYLLSKKFTFFEIMAECTDKGLLAPTEEDLQEIADGMGAFPASWQSSVSKTNSVFYRWLRNLDVLDMWKQTPDAANALQFVRMRGIRKDFEALMLMHKDVSSVRDEILLKYSKDQVPCTSSLTTYCEYFWNLGSMSYEGIFTFLEENQEREELLPAVQGDLTGTYSRLGLRQRIEAEQFYDNIIALANQQVEQARRRGHEGLNGSSLMGIAALTRQAIDALKARDELHLGETTTTIDLVKEQAAAFKLRMVKGESIPSFDDLQKGDVIDAEFTEEDNVRQFNRG
jgi:hypothetical protein